MSEQQKKTKICQWGKSCSDSLQAEFEGHIKQQTKIPLEFVITEQGFLMPDTVEVFAIGDHEITELRELNNLIEQEFINY